MSKKKHFHLHGKLKAKLGITVLKYFCRHKYINFCNLVCSLDLLSHTSIGVNCLSDLGTKIVFLYWTLE